MAVVAGCFPSGVVVISEPDLLLFQRQRLLADTFVKFLVP